MAKKVFNMQGGLHSAAAYSALENRAWGSCVADVASFVPTPSAGMNISVSTGDGLISVDSFNARRIQVTAAEVVPVPASSASFARLDTLVAYIDNSVTPVTSVVDNVNDVLKFMVVAGTAASTPVAPSGAAIQAAIGAGNPYMPLYDLRVPQGATNTTGVTFTDRRSVINIIQASQLPTDIVTTPKIKNKAVTSDKIDFGTFSDKFKRGNAPALTPTSTSNVTQTYSTVEVGDSGALLVSIVGVCTVDFNLGISLSGANTLALSPDNTNQGKATSRQSLTRLITGLSPGPTTITVHGSRQTGTGAVSLYAIVDTISF